MRLVLGEMKWQITSQKYVSCCAQQNWQRLLIRLGA